MAQMKHRDRLRRTYGTAPSNGSSRLLRTDPGTSNRLSNVSPIPLGAAVASNVYSVTLAAFASIIDPQRRILLVRRRDLDVWECPGGSVEPGETPWEAVVRETREETGLEVAAKRIAGLYWRSEKGVLVVQFICTITGGDERPTTEAAEVAYFAPDALPPRLTPVVKQRIEDSLANPGAFRTQDGSGAKEFMASFS